ncbi:hypothetical protein K1T71_014214 [Dendrolimus kikuchii]|uniref:Uncharacterized protein n=1 Tax=Dendrolimus kikuchii TaxID=765133 RepID=A0ACC1CFN1_9NEOP|nr:hypothetical protein K1T71_014214 [Dendrolimus kikuchii]
MDPNCTQNGQVDNPDDFYNNTYSLWQNSRFYDTNNLSPQNYNSNQWNTSKEFIEKPSEVKKDVKNRRIITRTLLYEDPELFYEKNYPQPETSGFDWTKYNWTKASENIQNEPSTSNENQVGSVAQYQRPNRIQQNLEEMLNQPVQLSKAESMMQKMGWQGGALGKSGSGIVEPVKPNARYAIRTRGLGQNNVPRVKKMRSIDNNKNIFTTNVLLFILEFVKDDMEAELLFDSCLWKEERKWIHSIVNDVINAEDIADCDSVRHLDIVNEIYKYNCFVLATQSEGQAPNRQLCLFKEAPPNMYLITPSDLKDEPDEPENMETDIPTDKQTENPSNIITEKDVKKNKNANRQTKMDIEHKNVNNSEISNSKKHTDTETDIMDIETNPFLRSITRNLKNQEDSITDKLKVCTLKDESEIYRKIVEYFFEFADQEDFTELRFLGAFNEDEVRDIIKFFDDTKKCVNGNFDNVNEELVGAFKTKSFDVHEDVNGFTSINDRPVKSKINLWTQ